MQNDSVDQATTYATVLKVDNAAIVEFLTTAVGVLSTEELVSSKDIDNLRLVLAGIQSDANARRSPVLVELIEQNAEALTILGARFGESGLARNLLRHSTRQPLDQIISALFVWTDSILGRSEMLFNRPMHLFNHRMAVDQTVLCSQVLVDFAGALCALTQRLKAIQQQLARLIPSQWGIQENDSSKQIDELICQALGFHEIAYELPLFSDESTLKQDLVTSLSVLTQITNDTFEQFERNTANHQFFKTTLAAERLRAEISRLSGLNISVGDTFAASETRRQSFVHCLFSIGEALKTLTSTAGDALAKFTPKSTTKVVVPEAIWNHAVFDLISAGLGPQKSKEAVDAFAVYCTEHNIGPGEVLAGELTKIHAQLLPRTLECVQRLTIKMSDTTTSGFLVAKDSTLKKSEKLRRILAEKSASLMVFAALALAGSLTISSFVACGVKTPPRSDVIEYRPDIPFRNAIQKTQPAIPPPGPAGSTTASPKISP